MEMRGVKKMRCSRYFGCRGSLPAGASGLKTPHSIGFTLVEVMVASLMLALLSVAMFTGSTFASRMARINSNAIAAKNVAQGYFERMAIDNFANIGPTQYPDINYDSVPPVWLDRAMDIRCRIQFSFKGFGTLTNASANSLTDSNSIWETDEWAGDMVYLISGAGAGQFAQINTNTPSTLQLATALAVAPLAGAKYMINNGKTVEITTTWRYLGKEYSQTIESLVNNYRNSSNFGF